MKPLPVLMLSLALAASFSAPATAANLMLDFGATPVDSPYLTLSPGHAAGGLTAGDSTWNTVSTAASHSSLSYSDGSGAPGVTLVLGQEATVGSGTISYSTAIGLRLDGLAAGDYTVYLMGRNTNSNAGLGSASSPTNTVNRAVSFHVTTDASSGSFSFGALAAETQANTHYPTATYAGQFNSFAEGENYVAFTVTVAAGESLFVAADGTGSSDTRGFLNMVQIVAVPEPSLALLGSLGLLSLLRRRR